MHNTQRLTMVIAVVGLFAFATTRNVSAQVCGDADGSGSVTVTDGVQVLRAAAELSSDCAQRANSCDVDGNGSVTVSDGVNVLRKAADLPITEACPGGGGNTAEVAAVTDLMVPFLTLGLSQVSSVGIGSASAAVAPAGTENCEDGGSRTTSSSPPTPSVTFSACRVSQPGLGRFQFDGQIAVNILTGNAGFELQVTDLDNGNRVLDFDGTIQGQVQLTGGFVVDGGPLAVHESEGGPTLFTLTFHDLTVDGDGKLVSGSVEAEDTSDSFALETAELEVESSTTATVHVVRDDQSTGDFTLNLQTGDLTPVS